MKTIRIALESVPHELTAPVITQQLQMDQRFYEFSCQYLHPSFTFFKNDIQYYHIAPLFSRLILVECGQVDLQFSNGKTAVIRPGQIYHLASQHPFHTTYRHGSRTYGFHLYLRDELGRMIGPGLPDLVVSEKPELIELLRLATKEKDPNVVHPILMAVIVDLLRDHLHGLMKNTALTPVCRRIVEKLRRAPSLEIQFTDIAAKEHLTLSSMTKQFRKCTGQTPQEYRAGLILEKARYLLENTDMTASEIASSLGYSDINAFFVFFRRKVGVTPLDYRRSCRK